MCCLFLHYTHYTKLHDQLDIRDHRKGVPDKIKQE
jgi:hypothetical protein